MPRHKKIASIDWEQALFDYIQKQGWVKETYTYTGKAPAGTVFKAVHHGERFIALATCNGVRKRFHVCGTYGRNKSYSTDYKYMYWLTEEGAAYVMSLIFEERL